MAEMRSFVFSGEDSCPNPVLVAGDSNVRRMRDVSQKLKCLAVSGARFHLDRKNFKGSLKTELQHVTYSSIYLHLGSNDVLCNEDLFYRSVTKLCDYIHGLAPLSEIVLCEIPQRVQDKRRGRWISGLHLQEMRCWIWRINNLLWELACRVPYLRFHGYGTPSLNVKYLCTDGLHLTEEGARVCLESIEEDQHFIVSDQEEQIEEERPTMTQPIKDESCKPEVEVKPVPDVTYASVLKEHPPSKPLSIEKCEVVNEEGHEEKKQTLKPKRCRLHTRQSRKYIKKRKSKKSHRKVAPRSYTKYDSVNIHMIGHVGVQVKLSLIHGSYLRKACVSKAVGQNHLNARKLVKKIPLKEVVSTVMKCPDCDVICCTDTDLLDHVIEKHVSVCKDETVMIQENKAKNKTAVKRIEINTSSSEQKQIRTTFCEDTFFSAREWLHHAMMALLSHQNVDTAKLLLLLSNDVEQNPGPTQFNTIEAWFESLPGGFNTVKTDLSLCPKDLRSKLKLLLFDEDFCIPYPDYTVEDHLRFLKRLSTLNFSNFKDISGQFITKRTQLGESWQHDDYLNQWKSPFSGTTSKKVLYTVPNEGAYDFVSTSRPELCTEMYCGTRFQSNSLKRKISTLESDMSNQENDWSNNLIQNLKKCHQAIGIQKDILQEMFENELISAKKQSFIQIEQTLAHLSSIQNCCLGTFMFTVFDCLVQNKKIVYIRYFESGIYTGLMIQKYLDLIQSQIGIPKEDILLHNVITTEDVRAMEIKNIGSPKKTKRFRPDKTYHFAAVSKLPIHVQELTEIQETTNIHLNSFLVHMLPFNSKSSIDTPEKHFLYIKNCGDSEALMKILLNFRLHKTQVLEAHATNIYSLQLSLDMNLFEQSVFLNCLSGDIKRKSELFKREARFESNFIFSKRQKSMGTSLRNKTFGLFIKSDYSALISFYKEYFAELKENDEINVDIPVETGKSFSNKKRKIVKSVQSLPVTKTTVASKLPAFQPEQSSQIISLNLFETYCCSILDHGIFKVQSFGQSGNLVCIMNDYSDSDGSFKQNDFVHTFRFKQETGNHLFCTCSVYKTLLDCRSTAQGDSNIGLDCTDKNSVTCLHCRYMQQVALPYLDRTSRPSETLTRTEHFISEGMNSNGSSIIEVSRSLGKRKYSILIPEEDRPSFVHCSLNKSNGYIVTCKNGKCRARKGYKKSLTNFQSGIVCSHLSVLKQHRDFWLDLMSENSEESDSSSSDTEEYNTSNTNLDLNFDVQTGLWNFKSLSEHMPCKVDSSILITNVLKRDTWNDSNLLRLSDGCLKGPILFPDIPDNTCSCGEGWLKRSDHRDYNENGKTVHDRKRVLTIYTETAPVKCEVHSRICYNTDNPCKINWDEGLLDSLHVLSRETAAGDEIGWEFVSLVISTGCTFSSYCQHKTIKYQIRDKNAKFMDHTVFLNWWFSWAANMKIDFRKPCDICKFEPKRLCCDGTKLGVGFRHANFEEINKCDPAYPVQQTLHRRMDRCFLKNMGGIDKQFMIQNRLTLDYLARKALGALNANEVLSDQDLAVKVIALKQVLPEEIVPSFDRFSTMSKAEKLAYARLVKMLATTASVTTLLPPKFCPKLQELVTGSDISQEKFDDIMQEMRCYCPELRDLIAESMLDNEDILPNDIRLLVQYLINESLDITTNDLDPAVPQPETYNPAKFGRAYYFNEFGLKLRNIKQFTIDNDNNVRRNIDHDDAAFEFERCQKLYSKVHTSARGTSNLFLWFCADHGHCYGFHMTCAEGRKDPAASLYSHLEKPPEAVFYDFACNLQEYCLNRESNYYRDVQFFHDIFHGYSHKCSCAFKSSRLQGYESVNSEICEQFNSFIQCIKKSARQMSQTHFCFYLQFFLNEWNARKRQVHQNRLRVALAGLE